LMPCPPAFFIGFNKNRNLFGIKPIKDVGK
jgi:hypothetical protein